MGATAVSIRTFVHRGGDPSADIIGTRMGVTMSVAQWKEVEKWVKEGVVEQVLRERGEWDNPPALDFTGKKLNKAGATVWE